MGTCPNCGLKKFRGPTIETCIVCRKQGCSNCITNFLLAVRSSPRVGRYDKAVYACSTKCAEEFRQMVFKAISLDEAIEARDYDQKQWNTNYYGMDIFDEACFQVLMKLNTQLVQENQCAGKRAYTVVSIQSPMFKKYHDDAVIVLAQKIEAVGRFSDAAHVYETYGMYDEARDLREKERTRQIIVKKTQVSVDLNALLQQVKDGGIVAVYRCPQCGANLEVGKDSQLEQLKVCKYCQAEIKAMDLADFLRTALS
jgi:DNA-directed RNA polymerase subunit RPC12/RpoP